jgi:GNAT superfamily N-acetyltransferase
VQASLAVREITDPADPVLPQVRRLYERTIDRATRIPWGWIARGVGRRHTPHDRWWTHLLLAADAGGRALGFFHGAYLPGLGGYPCYLGVAPAARGHGLGRRLYERLFEAFRRDADRLVEPLPFALWESDPPTADDGDEAQINWRARLRLFERVGALWVAWVDFRVPNYMDDAAPATKLELFLRPFDTPAEQFKDAELRRVVGELYRRVYNQGPGDELYEQAFAPDRELLLRPVAEYE